jgi:hypothetical protein
MPRTATEGTSDTWAMRSVTSTPSTRPGTAITVAPAATVTTTAPNVPTTRTTTTTTPVTTPSSLPKGTASVTGYAPSLAPVGSGGPGGLVQRLSGFQGVQIKRTVPGDDATVRQSHGETIKRFLTLGGMAGCAMAMMCLSACTTMSSGGPGGPSITQTSGRQSPDVQRALQACDGSAASIARCRSTIAGLNLGAADRAAAYRGISEKITYRNQRNTPAIGDSMCNVTSMAMALNGLGIGADETHVEFEKRLADELSGKGLRRTDEHERLAVARSRGVTASTVFVGGAFNDADGARQWYAAHVQPKLDTGAQAIMSISVQGASGHVLHIVGCSQNGIVVNDPYSGQGRLNGTTSQDGNGRHVVLPWSFVAEHNAQKYVQLLSR